jgi:hypothetical protein
MNLRALSLFAGLIVSTAATAETGADCAFWQNCLPDKAYHSDNIASVTMMVENHGWDVLRPEAKPSEKVYRPTPFDKAWLEYGENGAPFGDQQKQAIIKRIRSYGDEKRPVFVVAYVHGWHHNANDKDPLVPGNNAIKFDYFMARQADQLRRNFEQQGNSKVPAVIGIFIGWRGERYSNSPMNMASIKDRAEAADRLGLGRRSNPDLKSDLGHDLKDIADAVRAGSPDGRIMVVGHSLGGRVLTRAFVDDVTNTNTTPLGSGSLIVTLNAAVGADCFDRIYLNGGKSDGDAPFWINVTSKDDDATNKIYHTAAWIPGFKPPSCDGGSKARGIAIGHYPDYVTHNLTFEERKAGKFPLNAAEAKTLGLPDTAPGFPPLAGKTDWFRQTKMDGVLGYRMFDLENCPYKIEACYTRDSLFYAVNFSSGAIKSNVWNIVTDKNTINLADQKDRKPQEGTVDAKHNGYVSTNLTRLLVEIVYRK